MTDPDFSLASAVRSLGQDLQLRISANVIQIGMLADRAGRIERCLADLNSVTARIDRVLSRFEQDQRDADWWRGDGCGGDECGGRGSCGGDPDVEGPSA